jgi:ABC-type glycerol-3-phosphate transport system substrate-binding protein
MGATRQASTGPGGLSRRAVLKAGAAVPAGALLASLAARGAHAQSTAPATEDFTGVHLIVTTRGAGFDDTGMFKRAVESWTARTGGTVEFQLFSAFTDFDIKYAGYVTSQDPSVDLLYSYEGFNLTYGERLYEDLGPLVGDTSDFLPGALKTHTTLDGKLRVLPCQGELVLFAYNAQQYEAAGIDPDAPPDTWAGLYEHADAFRSADIYGHISGILAPGHSLPWFFTYYNSTGQPFLSDDRRSIAFDNPEFDLSLQTLMDGIDAGFYDPDGLYLATTYDHTKPFYEGAAASTTTFGELVMEALDPEKSPNAEHIRTALMPGVRPGTSGTFNGYEGFAINQFGVQKEAALSLLLELAGFDSQKSVALGENFTALPPSRLSVYEDPDVEAGYPLTDALFAQAQTETSRWGAPYFSELSAIFDDVLPKMANKELTVAEARAQLVERSTQAVADYYA